MIQYANFIYTFLLLLVLPVIGDYIWEALWAAAIFFWTLPYFADKYSKRTYGGAIPLEKFTTFIKTQTLIGAFKDPINFIESVFDVSVYFLLSIVYLKNYWMAYIFSDNLPEVKFQVNQAELIKGLWNTAFIFEFVVVFSASFYGTILTTASQPLFAKWFG